MPTAVHCHRFGPIGPRCATERWPHAAEPAACSTCACALPSISSFIFSCSCATAVSRRFAVAAATLFSGSSSDARLASACTRSVTTACVHQCNGRMEHACECIGGLVECLVRLGKQHSLKCLCAHGSATLTTEASPRRRNDNQQRTANARALARVPVRGCLRPCAYTP